MRRIVFSLLLIVFGAVAVNGQSFRFGIHTGVDAATLRFAGAVGGPINYKNELTAGLSGEAVVSTVFSVLLEANYSQQGVAVVNDDGSNAASIGSDYITVPLLAKLHATPRLSFYGGPQAGFLLSAKQRMLSAPGSTDVKEGLESTDFYGVLGAGYRFANGVTLDARYHLGLTNIAKEETSQNLKNLYFSFRVGYSFGFGK